MAGLLLDGDTGVSSYDHELSSRLRFRLSTVRVSDFEMTSRLGRTLRQSPNLTELFKVRCRAVKPSPYPPQRLRPHHWSLPTVNIPKCFVLKSAPRNALPIHLPRSRDSVPPRSLVLSLLPHRIRMDRAVCSQRRTARADPVGDHIWESAGRMVGCDVAGDVCGCRVCGVVVDCV